jgi:hypothetical protein
VTATPISATKAILVVSAIGVLLTLPSLLGGLPIGHDTLTHLQWHHHFAKQFWAGEPYPRWLSGMNAGYGSPAFFFYAPLPYMLTSLLRPLLPGDPIGLRALGVSAALAFIASGVACFAWLVRRSGTRAALAGAAVYLLLPYHLVVDLYDRAAFAELWAFVWLPLVMLGAEKIACGERRGVATLALAEGGLIATHLPAALLFAPVPFIVAALDKREDTAADREASSPPRLERSKSLARTLAKLAAGAALGVALSAVYLLPALASRQHVLLAESQDAARYFANNFLFDFGGGQPYAGYLARLALVTALSAAFVTALFVVAHRARRREAVAWLAIAGGALLMMLAIARPLWNAMPPLQAIQFPWRFHTVVCVAGAALAARATAAFPAAGRAARIIAFGALAMAVAFAALAVAAQRHALEERANADMRLLAASTEIGFEGRQFRPRWANLALFTSAPLGEIAQRAGTASMIHGEGSARAVRRSARMMTLTTETAQDATVVVHQFYYPGWTARVAQGERLQTGPSPDGLIQIAVPAGHHEITLRLEPGASEKVGVVASAAAAIVVCALLVAPHRRLA